MHTLIISKQKFPLYIELNWKPLSLVFNFCVLRSAFFFVPYTFPTITKELNQFRYYYSILWPGSDSFCMPHCSSPFEKFPLKWDAPHPPSHTPYLVLPFLWHCTYGLTGRRKGSKEVHGTLKPTLDNRQIQIALQARCKDRSCTH